MAVTIQIDLRETHPGWGAFTSYAMTCHKSERKRAPLTTPDGRYIVVRGRLWRASDPSLDAAERQRLVDVLMDARRAVAAARRVNDETAEAKAHATVDRAKHGLGERGPVWWTDGAPDFNRHLARTTPYAEWFASQG